MHHLPRLVPVFAVALCLSLAAAARAQVALPAAAIDAETAAVVWVDFSGLDTQALRASVERINRSLAPELAATEEDLQAGLDPQLADIRQRLDAAAAAGAKGVAFVMTSPAAAGPAGNPGGNPGGEPLTLVHVAPGTTGESLVAAIQEAGTVEQNVSFRPVNEQWLAVDNPQTPLPAQGDPAAAAAFADLLARSGDAPIRIAFRITPSIRQAAAQAQADPAAGPAAGMAGLFQFVQHGWATVSFGPNPRIRHTLAFDTAASAQQFKVSWDGLLMMGQGAFLGQTAQLPDAPAAETVQALFTSLKFQQDGSNLSLTLGDGFIDSAAEVLPPVVQPLMMMFMMNMNSGMGGPGMAPAGPGMGGPMGR